MAKRIDLTGQRFGRWTVIAPHKPPLWECECDCGTKRLVQAPSLKIGSSKSCGCYKDERVKTHGKSGTPIYEVWRTMLKRCNSPTSRQYHNYGARGIRVCERWHTFENFYADMGDAPEGKSLDRIDNDGNYEPSNCRWTTQKQQIRNKRNTSRVMYRGKTVPLAELCEKRGLPLKRVRNRIYAGWPLEQALDPDKQSRWRTGR